MFYNSCERRIGVQKKLMEMPSAWEEEMPTIGELERIPSRYILKGVVETPSAATQTAQKAHAIASLRIGRAGSLLEKHPILDRAPISVVSKPPEGSNLSTFLYVHGDGAGVPRACNDLMKFVRRENGLRPSGFELSDRQAQILGLTTINNVFTGLTTAREAAHASNYSREIGDATGLLNSNMSLVQGSSAAAGAGLFTSYRVMSMLPHQVAAASAVGNAGSALYMLNYVMKAGSFIVNGRESFQFRKEMQAVEASSGEGDAEQKLYGYLADQVFLSEGEVNEAVKEALSSDTYLHEKDEDRVLDNMPTRARLKRVLPEGYAFEFAGKRLAFDGKLQSNLVALCGSTSKGKALYAKIIYTLTKRMDVKHLKMMRGTDDKVLGSILEAGKSPEIAKQREIAIAAKTTNRRDIWKNALGLFATIVGVGAFVAATVGSGGTTLIVAATFMVVASVLMSAIDISYLKQAMRTTQPTKKEKWMMFTLSVFFIGVSLAATVMSGGAAAMVVPAAVGVAWTLLYLGAYFYWIGKNKDHYNELDPALTRGIVEAAPIGL